MNNTIIKKNCYFVVRYRVHLADTDNKNYKTTTIFAFFILIASAAGMIYIYLKFYWKSMRVFYILLTAARILWFEKYIPIPYL